MTVRSTKLGVFHIDTTGFVNFWATPAGWRTIVKEIVFDNGAAPPGTVTIIAQDSALGINVMVVQIELQGNQTAAWNGWLVLNPDDTLWVNYSNPPGNIWASGTLLQLTGAEPTAAALRTSPGVTGPSW